MTLSSIQKLERERQALDEKIAAERARIASRIGADLVRILGEETAQTLLEHLRLASKEKRLETLLQLIANEGCGGALKERRHGAGEAHAASDGASS
jgi:3-keto-L-gulonate-6-phosphate decarboxylase